MIIKIERNDGLKKYCCTEPNCIFYSYFYRDFMKHVWGHDKKKKVIQTTFEDDSLNNYALVKFSGGIEE